jgi:hypothetical protein
MRERSASRRRYIVGAGPNSDRKMHASTPPSNRHFIELHVWPLLKPARNAPAGDRHAGVRRRLGYASTEQTKPSGRIVVASSGTGIVSHRGWLLVIRAFQHG